MLSNLSSQELYLVSLLTFFALIGVSYVLRGAIRWLRDWEGPKTELELLGAVCVVIGLIIAAVAFGSPPLIYYFGNYVGAPLGMILKQWWNYWGF